MNFRPIIKPAAAIAVSAVIIYAGYIGTYLPIVKSRMYIAASQATDIRSLDEFNKVFDPVLDFYSPVGQEEITSNYLDILVTTIKNQKDKGVVDYLVRKGESAANPIIEKGAGFGFSQILLWMGSLYQEAYLATGDNSYYDKSVAEFRLGLKYSPNRPSFLYNLFYLYDIKHDKNGIVETGNVILKYWPNESKVRQEVEAASK